jgi:hypothetical protein
MPKKFGSVFGVAGLEKFGVGCRFSDGWTKGTTVFNQQTYTHNEAIR